jgi:cyclic dehypoxanthinyl futalosine synthase
MDKKIETVLEKAWKGNRLSPEEGTLLFQADLMLLGKVADACRRRILPGRENIVTFAINRNLNYTNICYVGCDFCAYYRKPGDPDAYLLTKEEIFQKLDELKAIGGTEVLLQGGLHHKLGLDFYLDLISSIVQRYPEIYIHSLSVSEIYHLCRKSGLPLEEVLRQLQQAGLKSIPGAAELLVDRVRESVSPNKVTARQWLDCMETAHKMGMESTATMTFGMGETLAERVEHFEKVRALQDRTHGFRAFIAWPFSPYHTKLSHLKPTGGVDYLRTVAAARIYLDNIPHVTSGYVTEGMKLAQVALSFGCNDMGGTLMQEEVLAATGTGTPSTNLQTLIDTIKGAGKIPAQRDSEYHILRKFE